MVVESSTENSSDRRLMEESQPRFPVRLIIIILLLYAGGILSLFYPMAIILNLMPGQPYPDTIEQQLTWPAFLYPLAAFIGFLLFCSSLLTTDTIMRRHSWKKEATLLTSLLYTGEGCVGIALGIVTGFVTGYAIGLIILLVGGIILLWSQTAIVKEEFNHLLPDQSHSNVIASPN